MSWERYNTYRPVNTVNYPIIWWKHKSERGCRKSKTPYDLGGPQLLIIALHVLFYCSQLSHVVNFNMLKLSRAGNTIWETICQKVLNLWLGLWLLWEIVFSALLSLWIYGTCLIVCVISQTLWGSVVICSCDLLISVW